MSKIIQIYRQDIVDSSIEWFTMRAMTDGEGELSLPRRVGLLVDDGQALVGDVEYSWENRAHETFLWVDLLYHNVQWGIPTEVKGDKEFGKNRRFPGILWRVASLAA